MQDDLDLRDFDGRCRLFPLPGVVLFPHAVLPLHIFEPRYRQMTQDALASDKLVAIVQVRPDADWSGASEPQVETVACLGKILNHERLPDGRFNFLLLGRKRIRIVRELDVPTLYRQAEVEILEDIHPDPPDTARRGDLIGLYREVARRADVLDPDLDNLLRTDPPLGVVTDLLAQALGLPPSMRQAFLADPRVDRRADGLLAVLRQVASHLDPIPDAARPFPPPFSAN